MGPEYWVPGTPVSLGCSPPTESRMKTWPPPEPSHALWTLHRQAPDATRHAVALRQRFRYGGPGRAAGRTVFRGVRPSQPVGPAASALFGPRPKRDLSVHGRRPLAGGHLRP